MDLVEQIYQRVLGSERAARLQVDLEVEDERLEIVRQILHKADALPESMASYSTWDAFSGGGENLLTAVEQARHAVAEAAARTGADVPPFECKLRPSWEFTSRTISMGPHVVVVLYTGLLNGMVQFLQAVAAST